MNTDSTPCHILSNYNGSKTYGFAIDNFGTVFSNPSYWAAYNYQTYWTGFPRIVEK